MVLRDLEVQYWEVRKSIPFDLAWKNIFQLTKKKSMYMEVFRWFAIIGGNGIFEFLYACVLEGMVQEYHI